MKKTIVIMVFTILGLVANAAKSSCSDSSEEIRIKDVYQSETEVERSISLYVNAVLLKDLGQVEVEYFGLKNPSIFLMDAEGQIVDEVTELSYFSVEYLPVPSYSGTYTLVIRSDNYCGYGIFTI